MSNYQEEIKKGKRFSFGKNWKAFSCTLDQERIETSKHALIDMLGISSLDGKRFLDVGSGSGLSSLAASLLGASVESFDYDAACVECTKWMREQYTTSSDKQWIVHQGSILDAGFLKELGKFDIVYAWGVLHHTGQLWQALENTLTLVSEGGCVFIAIYNDQRGISRLWTKIKKFYCSGLFGKTLICSTFIPFLACRLVFWGVITGRNFFKEHNKIRGMSIFYDWFDWLGGYPFEVASVESIFDFFRQRGFVLSKIKTVNGAHGNNEFVFKYLPNQRQ